LLACSCTQCVKKNDINQLPIKQTLPLNTMVTLYRSLPCHLHESILFSLANALGRPLAYEGERQGWYIHDIRSVGGKQQEPTSFGGVSLGLHTEMAFHPIRPSYVLLFCMNPSDPGPRRHLFPRARSLPISMMTSETRCPSPCSRCTRRNRTQKHLPHTTITRTGPMSLALLGEDDGDNTICTNPEMTVWIGMVVRLSRVIRKNGLCPPSH